MDSLVAEIATASQEQTQGINQVNRAVSQMDKVTQANAGNAEETAAASEQLSTQAAAMQTAVKHLAEVVGGSNVVDSPAEITPLPTPIHPATASQTIGGTSKRILKREPVAVNTAQPDAFFDS